MNIKLSTKTQKILEFLQEWQEENHLYDLMHFHTMEIFTELEKYDYYLESMWDIDLTKYFDDEFYTFSTEGGTGEFAFWYYKDLQGEAPIVLLPNGGEEPTFLAASLNDLVCKIIHNIGFNGGWHDQEDKQPTEEDFEEQCHDIAYHKKINEEVKQIILKERQEFKERALKLIDFISEEDIEKNIKKHPCFVARVNQFHFKNAELYYLKHEIQNEEDLLKLLNIYKNMINSSFWGTSKNEVIDGMKGNYPNYYKSALFKTWLADLEKPVRALTDEEKTIAQQIADFINHFTNQYVNEDIKTDFVQDFKATHPEIYKLETYKKYIDKMGAYLNETKA